MILYGVLYSAVNSFFIPKKDFKEKEDSRTIVLKSSKSLNYEAGMIGKTT
jgi:hypothetical protein